MITDYTIALGLVEHCWYEISEDDAPKYIPDVINEIWVGLHNGDNLVGGYRIHQINGVCYQGHAFMIPEYRKQYSVEGCITTLKYITETIPGLQKLIASTPAKFKNVMHFLEKIGFKEEGVNRLSYRKDGKIWDVVNYGLTLDEIKEVILAWQQRQ